MVAILAGVNELALPAAVLQQRRAHSILRLRELRLKQHVCMTADSLVAEPAVELFRTAIPVRDGIVHVPHEDGVVRELEQICLLTERVLRRLIPQGEKAGDSDRRKTDDATDEGRTRIRR